MSAIGCLDFKQIESLSWDADRCGFRNRSVDAPFKGVYSVFQKRVVSKKELKTVCGIPYSPQHVARLEAAGQFPKRIQLGKCRVAWLVSEVEAWLDERIAKRDANMRSDASS